MKFKVLDTELEFDFLDAEESERMEAAADKCMNELKKLDGIEFERQSEQIRAFCKPYHDMFDEVFGEGTAGRIFKRINYGDCLKAADDFNLAKASAVEDYSSNLSLGNNKQSTMNRAARRQASRNNKPYYSGKKGKRRHN